MSQPQQMIRCLICNQLEPKRTLISHISEHVAVGLKPHICGNCDFQTGFEFWILLKFLHSLNYVRWKNGSSVEYYGWSTLVLMTSTIGLNYGIEDQEWYYGLRDRKVKSLPFHKSLGFLKNRQLRGVALVVTILGSWIKYMRHNC